MKQFVTRMGEDTRYVIDGDLRQSQVKRGENGLEWALRLVRQYPIDASVIEFRPEDVVRSKTVAQWVNAIEKDEGHSDSFDADEVPQFLRMNARRSA